MTTDLADTVRQNATGFKALRETITTNVERQIIRADLPQLLAEGKFPAIAAAVQGIAKRDRRMYSENALFLILESIVTTWRMHVRSQQQHTGKTISDKDYDNNQALFLRQTLFDLTMWYSISNDVKTTRYTSPYLNEFIKHFQLRNDEIPDNHTDASTDDETAADAAADVTLTAHDAALAAVDASDSYDF
jgi:hypothetical protein